ncbi:hypothetical protein ACJRO7_033878 [Eucalyptus globulus]|uniref:Uncharacterized protein n=1 Tax=Eucalyptus globulus TaxID=34317 RepID=A0ABD3J4Z0_EUCGL
MDRDQHELQFLGFLGVYRESSKIILKGREIFAQITLTLILHLHRLPRSLQGFTAPLLQVRQVRDRLRQRQEAQPKVQDLCRMLKNYWLIELGYFISVFIFSLLSTSAVVYTVACIYATKQITITKMMSVVLSGRGSWSLSSGASHSSLCSLSWP